MTIMQLLQYIQPQEVAFVVLGLLGIVANLWLRGKASGSVAGVRDFYALNPPHLVSEEKDRLALLIEGAYQIRKYLLFAFCQGCFTTLGLLAMSVMPRPPRTPYDAFYQIAAPVLILSAELALDLVSVLAWRKTLALEELSRPDFIPTPAPDPKYHQGYGAEDPPAEDDHGD